ncbi:protein madd-4 [Caerostris extrusa]|uniref:Protein madd-4 n=1 Tax=Caerostris extrusa TaxID=172846 RepID=A0AAV4RV55_CAEEX|nr:protein madd-4 [Caerostris extrusa]
MPSFSELRPVEVEPCVASCPPPHPPREREPEKMKIVEEEVDASFYSWNTEKFSPCTASCSGGVHTSIVRCLRLPDEAEVSPQLCDQGLKPEPLTKSAMSNPVQSFTGGTSPTLETVPKTIVEDRSLEQVLTFLRWRIPDQEASLRENPGATQPSHPVATLQVPEDKAQSNKEVQSQTLSPTSENDDNNYNDDYNNDNNNCQTNSGRRD